MALTVAELAWSLDKTQHTQSEWFKIFRAHGVSEARIKMLLNPYRVYEASGKPQSVKYLPRLRVWRAFARLHNWSYLVGDFPTALEAIHARYEFIIKEFGPEAIIGKPPQTAQEMIADGVAPGEVAKTLQITMAELAWMLTPEKHTPAVWAKLFQERGVPSNRIAELLGVEPPAIRPKPSDVVMTPRELYLNGLGPYVPPTKGTR